MPENTPLKQGVNETDSSRLGHGLEYSSQPFFLVYLVLSKQPHSGVADRHRSPLALSEHFQSRGGRRAGAYCSGEIAGEWIRDWQSSGSRCGAVGENFQDSIFGDPLAFFIISRNI